jgi:uncharacterized protein YlaI
LTVYVHPCQNQYMNTNCEHRLSTLIETRGLGGWNPIEVYACDECGHRHEVAVAIETTDDDQDWS